MGTKNICLDIGGTKVLGVIFNENKEITHRVKKKTRAEKGFGSVEEKIVSVVEELIQASGMDGSDLNAIAAGAPGTINEDAGMIIYAPNLPWRNYNIRGVIEEKFKVPFYIGNDANVGMLGEWKFGAGIGKENIVGLFVGTGIGGGLILDNKLYSGPRHAAGEIGHIILDTEGPYCNCGQRGCLEAYASKIAITREIKAQLERGRSSLLQKYLEEDTNLIKSKSLKKALVAKDGLAIEVVNRAVHFLAAGAGSLVNIFNPEMLLLGGGVLEAIGDYMMPIFQKELERFAMPSVYEGTQVVQSALGDDAILYGALAMITDKKS